MSGGDFGDNSLLAYVSTARHAKSKEQIVNSCIVFYFENDIKNAKELFYNKMNQKIVWRRSDTKTRDNFNDIVDLFEKCDNEGLEVPKFVTANFDGFPPTYGFDDEC